MRARWRDPGGPAARRRGGGLDLQRGDRRAGGHVRDGPARCGRRRAVDRLRAAPAGGRGGRPRGRVGQAQRVQRPLRVRGGRRGVGLRGRHGPRAGRRPGAARRDIRGGRGARHLEGDRAAVSRRTRPAARCSSERGSPRWGPSGATAASTASGATCWSWNASSARPRPSRPAGARRRRRPRGSHATSPSPARYASWPSVAWRSASTRSEGRSTAATSAVVRPSGNAPSASTAPDGGGRRSSPVSRLARAVS